MGLKRMIRDYIPQPWLYVLQEHKVITKYVDLVYNTHCFSAKKKRRDPQCIKNCMFKIKRALTESNLVKDSTSFWYSFNSLELLSNLEREEWKKLDREIQNYKESCV